MVFGESGVGEMFKYVVKRASLLLKARSNVVTSDIVQISVKNAELQKVLDNENSLHSGRTP